MQRDSVLLRAIAVVTGVLYAAILADAFLFNGELRLWVSSRIAALSAIQERRQSRDPRVSSVLERARTITREAAEEGAA